MLWIFVLLACNGKGEEAPRDQDGDGFLSDTDCDDADAEVYPGAVERCNDKDDDCDGQIDDDPSDPIIWHKDGDGDGYGHEVVIQAGCDAPPGYVEDASDCDDDDPLVHPDADELCNGVDEDCDGSRDEDPVDAPAWYPDIDGDGFGADEGRVLACTQPGGHVAVGGDCFDEDATAFPGADETCNDRDDDCDGEEDEDPVDGFTWYEDIDGDGYGNERAPLRHCEVLAGRTETGGDCDDEDDSAFPGAPERCGDGRVNDCAGTADAAAAVCGGWGDPIEVDDVAAAWWGAAEASRLGATLAGGRDLDGDGRDDLLVGAFQASGAGGEASAGAVTIRYGDGREETLWGTSAGQELGSEVLLLPDLDRDGRAELALASTLTGEGGSGRVQLLSGADPRLSAALATWEGSGGELAGAEALASLGDATGDGVPDLLVGARYGSLGDTYAGQAYVLSGAARGNQVLSAATARLYARTGYGYAASRVAGPGDLDGDGLGDALVDGQGGVAAFLVLSPFTGDLDLEADADMQVTDGSGLGLSSAEGGDLDGDGHADLVLSSATAGTLASRGGAVFVHRGPFRGDVDLASAHASVLGSIDNGYLGGELALLPDLDGDGRPDLAIGRGSTTIRAGSLSTLSGTGGVLLFRAAGRLSGAWRDDEADLRIESATGGASFGADLALAGDVDGDGRSDLLIGAPAASLGGTGAAWLLRADVRY